MGKKSVLTEELKKRFGFDTFKGNQEAIINNVLNGNDTFVLMPTGGGKSLCYQLPAMLMEGTAIVISPLIALMKNQVDAIRTLSSEDGVALFLNSSLSKPQIEAVKESIMSGKTKMLYVAPESLNKVENVEFLKNIKISFYAVDEAHCISEWGHDFRPEYRRIRPIINKIGDAPVIALTATATPKVQHDIQKTLEMTNATVFKSSFNRANLYYEIRQKNTSDIDKEIIKFIKTQGGKSGIIYCLSRKKVTELSESLNLNGIAALPYHAGMEAAVRSENQDSFLMEKVNVIVATIAFGMGIDKPDVRYVIHYDIPKSLEGYYQETGRSGRDGGEGQCIAFYSRKDLQKLEKFMQGKPISEQEIGKQLLLETAAYAESSICRRKLLLHYFGEEYNEDNCGNCDNCLHPKILIDARDLLCAVLETIELVGEKFKAEVIIDILTGKLNVESDAYNFEDLELWNSVKDEEVDLLSPAIRQALISGYIIKDIENYGVLKITKEGKKFLKEPQKFEVSKDIVFSDDVGEVAPRVGSSAADPELFSILKDLRKKYSKKLGFPPFAIFQDPSLEAMSTTYPITIDELQNIPGVGEGRAKKFGQEFVDVIARYVDENDIVRPEDLRIKTVANKSKLKVEIIMAIDRKVALDELAISRGLELGELLDEVDSIVFSGTKLNIDYFLHEVMDDERIEEVFDYFKNVAESDDIDDAIEYLGEDEYTREEVRLVRIKFLLEVGN
ncbi:MAG: DNA helicase RecQ [Prevotellaceae bacterium]|jgi:ATP-dependent DNA helicase RecQ|nr:DNA helicase RecQ [Prevotellaceae bacterium]